MSDMSRQVVEALLAGGIPVGSRAAVRSFRCTHPGKEARGEYEQVMLYVGDRRIEVSVSPAGRSVRVWVDGKEVQQ